MFGNVRQVSMEGYEPRNVPFVVSGDEATVLNVTLRRLAVSTPTTSVAVVVESMMTASSPANTPSTSSLDYPGDGSTTPLSTAPDDDDGDWTTDPTSATTPSQEVQPSKVVLVLSDDEMDEEPSNPSAVVSSAGPKSQFPTWTACTFATLVVFMSSSFIFVQ